jgi:hypothetical protein
LPDASQQRLHALDAADAAAKHRMAQLLHERGLRLAANRPATYRPLLGWFKGPDQRPPVAETAAAIPLQPSHPIQLPEFPAGLTAGPDTSSPARARAVHRLEPPPQRSAAEFSTQELLDVLGDVPTGSEAQPRFWSWHSEAECEREVGRQPSTSTFGRSQDAAWEPTEAAADDATLDPLQGIRDPAARVFFALAIGHTGSDGKPAAE